MRRNITFGLLGQSVRSSIAFEFGGAGHVHAHPLKGLSLAHQGLVNFLVRVTDHGAHCASEEVVTRVSSPGL